MAKMMKIDLKMSENDEKVMILSDFGGPGGSGTDFE